MCKSRRAMFGWAALERISSDASSLTAPVGWLTVKTAQQNCWYKMQTGVCTLRQCSRTAQV